MTEQFNATKPVSISRLRDESLEGNLLDPDVLAQEIVEDLEAALEQFREIAADPCKEVAFKPDTMIGSCGI